MATAAIGIGAGPAPVAAADTDQPGLELIRNGGFEEPFAPTGVAAHWADNSAWAPVEVRYADETTAVQNGQHAQRIECTSFKGGAVQFVQFGLPVTNGGVYRITLWMKGTVGAPVEIQLRQGPAPYRTYASSLVPVTERWARSTFDLVSAGTDPAAMLIVRLGSTGALVLDDLSCRQVGQRDTTIRLDPPGQVIPPAFFGMHFHRNNPQTPWPPVPFGALRLWDARVSWPQLEPERGKWEFDRLDEYLDLAQQHSVEVLLPLGLTPTWASARPDEKSAYNGAGVSRDTGWAAEPRDFTDWDTYVRTVAHHCRGKVRTYEVWNEPNATGFFTGTVDQLVELTRRASRILKEVDPANRVVTPSIVGDVMYLDQFLGKGGARGAAVIGYHFYVWPDPPEQMVPMIRRTREIMTRHGVDRRPLWNTETGWNIESIVSPPALAAFKNRPPLSMQQAGDYIARACVLNWAAGVERYYFYAWDNGLMGLIEKDDTLKPPAHAYAEVYRWLVGSRMQSCETDQAGTWIARLERADGRKMLIAWNPEKDAEVRPPGVREAVHVRDLAGRERLLPPGEPVRVNASPVLIE